MLVEKSTSSHRKDPPIRGPHSGWPLLETVVLGGSLSPPSSHLIPGPSGSPRRLSPNPGPSGAPWSPSPIPGPSRPGSPRGAGALRLSPPSHPPSLDSVVFGHPTSSNPLSLDSVIFGQPARSPSSSPRRSGVGPNRRSPSSSPVGSGAGTTQVIHPVLLEMMPLPGEPGSSTNPGTIRPGPTQKWLAKAFYGGLIPVQRLKRKNIACSKQTICEEGTCCLEYGRRRKRCKPLGKRGDACSPMALTAVYLHSCPCGPLEGVCVDGVCK